MKSRQVIIGCYGTCGSYTEAAIQKWFGDFDFSVAYFTTFTEIADAFRSGTITHAVVPVKNSTVGAVVGAEEFLRTGKYEIKAEFWMPIVHSLLCKPNVKPHEIREVISHEQALGQCKNTVQKFLPGVKVTPFDDTARAAEYLARSKRRDICAIAHERCAKIFGLEILKCGAQDRADNKTKFLVLQIKKEKVKMKTNNKPKPISLEATRRALNLRDLSNPKEGSHAMQLLMNKVTEALAKHWQTKSVIYRESPIVSIKDNYDKIGYPKDGASRDSRYTRYVCDTALLRTMASAMVPRAIQSVKGTMTDSVLLVCPGLCYRRDCIDRIHVGEPHQVDYWYLTTGRTTVDDLKSAIHTLVKAIDPKLKIRTDDRLHPYTLNGVQVDVLWNGQWLELLECGIACPKVIKENLGRDDVTGIAMGPGLDRMLMVAKNITDIRLLRSTDPRIAGQMNDLKPYKEVSNMPSVKRDLSIVVANEMDNELLGDMVKESLGPDAEIIEHISIVSETPYSKLSQLARERQGMDETQKNILLRVLLRALDRTMTSEECNEYRNKIYLALHKGSVKTLAQ